MPEEHYVTLIFPTRESADHFYQWFTQSAGGADHYRVQCLIEDLPDIIVEHDLPIPRRISFQHTPEVRHDTDD